MNATDLAILITRAMYKQNPDAFYAHESEREALDAITENTKIGIDGHFNLLDLAAQLGCELTLDRPE